MVKDKNTFAKPFLKWAGGKGQLLEKIERYYPFEKNSINKYAEPFVGGGAVLFDILNKFNLEEIYISDVNSCLINTYIIIRDELDFLIENLVKIESEYIPLNENNRKKYYLKKRLDFNELIIDEKYNVDMASLMIFLNKTCFNGLYRVNRKGLFNVPHGKYKNPKILDKKNLKIVSEKLQKVKIFNEDFIKSEIFIDEKTFVYLDPPYKPLSLTANFISYSQKIFDDNSQIELASYIKRIAKKGAKFLLSNSDPKNTDKNDEFFDNLYSDFTINRVKATRMINSQASNRGEIKELLISNYKGGLWNEEL